MLAALAGPGNLIITFIIAIILYSRQRGLIITSLAEAGLTAVSLVSSLKQPAGFARGWMVVVVTLLVGIPKAQPSLAERAASDGVGTVRPMGVHGTKPRERGATQHIERPRHMARPASFWHRRHHPQPGATQASRYSRGLLPRPPRAR